MKTPKDIIEEFNVQFPLPKNLALSGGKGVIRDKQLQWLNKTLKSLLQSDIEELRGMKNTEKTVHTPNCQRGTCRNNHLFCKLEQDEYGYNEALDDIIQKKQQQLKELTK